MPGLGAPLVDFLGRREHAIHRTRGTEVPLLLEQRGMDVGRRLVDEPLAVQHVEHRLAFGRTQRARRRRTGPRWCGAGRGAPPAIERCPGHADALTQRRGLARRRDGLDGTHQSVSSSSRGVRGDPQDLGNFFLERDDRLRPLQLPLEPAILRLQLLHARVDGAGPPAAPPHLAQRPRLALPPPVRQQRRVQPLATQQGPHLAGLLARVGLLEDAEPILCGEAPALDRRRHLRVRVGRA